MATTPKRRPPRRAATVTILAIATLLQALLPQLATPVSAAPMEPVPTLPPAPAMAHEPAMAEAAPKPPPPRPARPPEKQPEKPPPPPKLASVLDCGLDAKDFAAVVQPTLVKGESVKVAGPSSVMVVANTSESLSRVEALARQAKAAAERAPRKVELQAVVLMDREPDTTTPAEALAFREAGRGGVPSERVAELLQKVGVTGADLSGLALPARLWRHAELIAPIGGAGENRAALTDRLTLLYDIHETPGGDYEARVTLAERDKASNPFDTGVLGKLLLVNRFRVDAGHPVVLGASSPTRSVMLALVIKPTQ